MFGFLSRKKQSSLAQSLPDYHRALVERGESMQFGFYAIIKNNQENLQISDPRIVAAATNWVWLFGDYGPKAEPPLKIAADQALSKVGSLLDESARVENTRGIIIAAAAQDVPMAAFKSHFDKLHALGIVMRAINIYNLEETLAEKHRPYYYYMQYGEQISALRCGATIEAAR